MLTSTIVKEAARRFGADLAGIGDMARFAGTPATRDPRAIAPGAKAIIGLGFRVLRGSLRGIEEGTQFYQYPTMGVMHIDEKFALDTLRRLACLLEDHGYEGVTQRAMPDRLPADATGTNPEWPSARKLAYAVPVSPGKPAPDVLPDFLHAAYLCGLGEIGAGGFFLTPEFGPLQRFAFLLTDAPLEPDPLYAGPALCDRCGLCASACPGKAFSLSKMKSVTLAGKVVEHAALDEWQCAAYYAGAYGATNPFLAPDALANFPDAGAILRGEKHLAPDEAKRLLPILQKAYFGVGGYQACLCGRVCYRACYQHLEEKGALTRTFHAPFRPLRHPEAPACS